MLLTITGYINRAPYLYQKDVLDLIEPTVPVSCISAQYAKLGSSDYTTLWTNIRTRVLSDDSIVMMSEEAMSLTSLQEEEIVLNKHLL